MAISHLSRTDRNFQKSLFWLTISLTFFLSALSVNARAQLCFNDAEGTAGFVWAYNASNDGSILDTNLDRQMRRWNSCTGKWEPMTLADPSIMKLQDNVGQTWFFLTGTPSGTYIYDSQCNPRPAGGTNFPVYRSTDLMHWYFHSWVFDPNMQGKNTWDRSTLFIPQSSGPNPPHRYLKGLGTPHLYYNPNNGDGFVYISFAAAELFNPGVLAGRSGDNDIDGDGVLDYDLDQDGTPDPEDPTVGEAGAHQQKTGFVVWTEKRRFLQGKHWVSGSFRNWFPVKYHYRENNVGIWRQDGGSAQAGINGAYTCIPTTGPTNILRRWKFGQYFLGNAVLWSGPCNWGFHFAGVGPRAWISVDSFVFFDPTDNCQPWLGWSWAQHNDDPNQQNRNNNNVAAFPLLGGGHWSQGFRLLDAFYDNPNFAPAISTQPLNLFAPYDPSTTFSGITAPANSVLPFGTGIPNGAIISQGGSPQVYGTDPGGNCGGIMGVAESTNIFAAEHNGNTWIYVTASRNPWDQPSYQIVYRNGLSLEGLHLPWNSSVPANPNEHVLLASNWIAQYPGTTRDTTDRRNFGGASHFRAYGRDYIVFHRHANTDSPSTFRNVFIKELTLNVDGSITRMWDGGTGNYNINVNRFRAPAVANVATPPVY